MEWERGLLTLFRVTSYHLTLGTPQSTIANAKERIIPRTLLFPKVCLFTDSVYYGNAPWTVEADDDENADRIVQRIETQNKEM